MSFLHQAAERGNAQEATTYDMPDAERHDYSREFSEALTRGGREVHKRTRWSTSLSNAVALLAGLSEAEAS
jgi:hypothetical protein